MFYAFLKNKFNCVCGAHCGFGVSLQKRVVHGLTGGLGWIASGSGLKFMYNCTTHVRNRFMFAYTGWPQKVSHYQMIKRSY